MTADQIARLAIALDEVRPPVRRRIEVPLTIRLDRLHEVFQAVMGWENYHLYEFRIGRDIAYGVPDPNGDFLGSSSRPANRTTLAQLVAQTRNKTFKPGFPRWIGPAGLKAAETLGKPPICSFTRRVRQDSAT